VLSDAGPRLSRRSALRLSVVATASLLAGGHAPYGQWGVYRRRYLLILTSRSDPTSYEFGSRLAAILAERLPDSRARVSRAPHNERIASLIASKQMDLALMLRGDAAALRDGAPPFTGYAPVALRAIIGVGDYLLVCRDDFPARHAWLICDALTKDRDAVPLPLVPPAASAEAPEAGVPVHVGAEAYFAGGPLPAHEPEGVPDQDHRHE
jgi:hypothetical protein